jgi:hypothetical protein
LISQAVSPCAQRHDAIKNRLADKNVKQDLSVKLDMRGKLDMRVKFDGAIPIGYDRVFNLLAETAA